MIQNCLNFLQQLSENNSREWFAENKKLYESAKADFEKITLRFIKEIGAFDEGVRNLTPRDCIFRIFRDVRFSKNKSPYKTNFGAAFNVSGRKVHNAGYYFHLAPGTSFMGGGIYMPEPETLKMIRQEIYYNYDEFDKIVSEKEFVKYYKGIDGSRLSLPPKGYPKDFKGIEMLKFKDYTAIHSFDPSKFSEEELFQQSIKVLKALKPLNDFLNRAVAQ
ncbi:MAG: DUF2461 domain-containing protein [Bacteroidota bacterium]